LGPCRAYLLVYLQQEAGIGAAVFVFFGGNEKNSCFYPENGVK